jgi:hypothetical protein
MKNNVLILLSSVGNLAQALKYVGEEDVLVIAMDEAARHTVQESGISYQLISEYLNLSEKELRDFADNFSLRWYYAGGVDYSQFDGCSLGELLYIEVSYKALFELERLIILIQQLMSHHSPQTWVLSTDQNRQLEQIIKLSSGTNVEIRVIPPSLVQWVRKNINFRGFKLWLRREGLDYYFRSIVFGLIRWIKIFSRKPVLGTLKPLSVFVVDIPNTSVMDTLVPLMRMIPQNERIVIASDPRCQKALDGYGINAIPFQAASLRLSRPTIPKGFHGELRRRWEKITKEIEQHGASMEFRGIDVWLFLRSYFRKMFYRRLPMALQHLRLARDFLAQYNACAVILAADNTYIGQVFTAAAKKLGIYSLTIQHGMVIFPQGYLPVRSTQLAVMGEAVRDWLVKYGARPEQIVVTGQPRFDDLVGTPKISSQQIFSDLNLQSGKPVWLLAPEPQLGLWMRDLLFATLIRFPDVQAIIRVHSNDNPLDYEMALHYHPDLIHRVRISRQHDVASILKACKVVIMGRSTIGLEALISGTYIISINPVEEAGSIVPPYLEEYLSRAPFLSVRRPDDFSHAWQEINRFENKEILDRLREDIIKRYAYANDGRNAERVVQIISSRINHPGEKVK